MILIEPTIQNPFRRAIRQRSLAAFLHQAAEAVRLPGPVSVLLTTDDEIRRLNREFRHKDKATDVLSFPAPSFPIPRAVDGQRQQAGDLALSVETAARQAQAYGHSLAVELQILLLHGLLHLAGFDHETDAGQMARRETRLRRKFGLNAGLIERTSGTRTRGQRSVAAQRKPARRRENR